MTRARASATRCCSPPESWPGTVVGARREADLLERRQRAPAALGARRRPRRAAGARRCAARVSSAEQVEALEHEADEPVADLGELGVGEPRRRRGPRGGSVPAVGRSRHPSTWSSVRLARAGRPGHGEELAGPDREVDGPERLDREGPLAVGAGDAVEAEEGASVTWHDPPGEDAGGIERAPRGARAPPTRGGRGRPRRASATARTARRSGRGSPRCGAGAAPT